MTPEQRRQRNKKLNDSRVARIVIGGTSISISKRNKRAWEACLYWQKHCPSLSDKLCDIIIERYKQEHPALAENNLRFFVDEHMSTISRLPRIDQFEEYRQAGGKSIEKLFEEGKIDEDDISHIMYTFNSLNEALHSPKIKAMLDKRALERAEQDEKQRKYWNNSNKK